MAERPKSYVKNGWFYRLASDGSGRYLRIRPAGATIKKPGKKTPPLPSSRPGYDLGVAISLGPLNERNRELREWITFPVTPQSIPVEHSASWTDGIFAAAPGSKERSRFVGPVLTNVTFSGRLEPPSHYVRMRSRAYGDVSSEWLRDANPLTGQIDVDAEMNLRGDILTRGTNPPDVGLPKRADGRDIGVIMEDGARAGPTMFYEPHAFRSLLARICETGEVVRLVVGDNFGWNKSATIRTFSWRYEEPDPDVLLFDIAFREHHEVKLQGVKKGKPTKKGTGKKTYRTKNGDTLQTVAAVHLGDAQKWPTVRKLNLNKFAGLWFYPASDGGSIGVRDARGASQGHRISLADAKKIGPDRRLRSGITLKLK